MGRITDTIENLKKSENLSSLEVYEKYPHLVELHKQELWDEHQGKTLVESKKKDLLLD